MSSKILNCVNFFNELQVAVNDITTAEQKSGGLKIVTAEYRYKEQTYLTRPLYYREITGLDNVRDIDFLHKYFGGSVYWLDLNEHDWPQKSEGNDLDSLISEMIYEEDNDFRSLLKLIANNDQTGYIQQITQEGRPARYYHTFENNNHWHDIILLIKAAISNNGEAVGKQFFQHLVFQWNEKHERSSLVNYGNTYKLITDLYKNLKAIQPVMEAKEIEKILEHKKQIILQGPPGTGKTRMAEIVATAFTTPPSITEEDIKDIVTTGILLPGVTNNDTFTVSGINDQSISLKLAASPNEYKPTFTEIRDAYTQRRWLNDIGKGNDSYAEVIASYIHRHFATKYTRLVQFHPSFSYEDFVRGIVPDSTKEGEIIYINVNKIFGELAEEALKNWEDHLRPATEVVKEVWIRQEMDNFAGSIQQYIDEHGSYPLNEKVSIFAVDDDAFRYSGMWNAPQQRMKFKDIMLGYMNNVTDIKAFKQLEGISGRTKGHTGYDFIVLEKFRTYMNTKTPPRQPVTQTELRRYVLIIDEINRANLSTVFGELIYALEYRGRKVESMYAVNESRKLIVPPNLYIIGTMNTADRSVGHIDYAIRRRFAFVDIPPADLSAQMPDSFHKTLFDKVSGLFESNLSAEFDRKDVQIGHSYFIYQKEDKDSLQLRLKYEIKPILLEYVKDGILVGDINGMKISKYIQELSV